MFQTRTLSGPFSNTDKFDFKLYDLINSQRKLLKDKITNNHGLTVCSGTLRLSTFAAFRSIDKIVSLEDVTISDVDIKKEKEKTQKKQKTKKLLDCKRCSEERKKTKNNNNNTKNVDSHRTVGHLLCNQHIQKKDLEVKLRERKYKNISAKNIIIGRLEDGDTIKFYQKSSRQELKCGMVTSYHGIVGNNLWLCSKCIDEVLPHVKVARDQIKGVFDEGGLAPNYPNRSVQSLIRCRINYCKLVGLDYGMSTFDNPLSFILFWYQELLGNHFYKDSILRLLARLRSLISSEPIMMVYMDDIVRTCLSDLDEYNFGLMFQDTYRGTNSSLWFGLKNVGGPRTPSSKKVWDSIKDWVSKKKDMHPFEERQMKQWISSWGFQVKRDYLTFQEFQTDPFRWATAGGAPRVQIKIPGYEKFEWRSKWAYAISKLSFTSDVYSNALAEGNNAAVALKEEAKTRTIITTPMASYLRQSYVLYLLGSPSFLSSTMANRGVYNSIRFISGSTYLCIDASRFDHSVSKQFMKFFWKLIGDEFRKRRMYEASEVCDAESDSLDSLMIHYDNNTTTYQGGLLSGWRVTTLIGSLKSALLCEYINDCLGKQYQYVVQGDDIMMRVDGVIDIKKIKILAKDLNITTNDDKTTSSTKGEFLKVQYDGIKATSYPVRSVRSIFYANPWLDTTAVKTPDQVASSWHGFYSRLSLMTGKFVKPHLYYAHFVENMYGWLGATMSKSMITNLLSTPISLGGLACSEFFDERADHYSYEQLLDKGVGGERWLLAFFGIDVEKTESKRFVVKKLNIQDIRSMINVKLKITDGMDMPYRRDDCNIFKTSLEIVRHKMRSRLFERIQSNCLGKIDNWIFEKRYLPRYLRGNSNWKQIFTFYNNPQGVSLPTSLFTRYDNNVALKKLLSKHTELVLFNTRYKTKNLVKAIDIHIFDRWFKSSQRLSSM